jgi:hypothetical protein
MVRIANWEYDHPKRTIGMEPDFPYLCDTHAAIWRETI